MKITNSERRGSHKSSKGVGAHLRLGRSCGPLRSPLVTFLGVVRFISSRSFQQYQLCHLEVLVYFKGLFLSFFPLFSLFLLSLLSLLNHESNNFLIWKSSKYHLRLSKLYYFSKYFFILCYFIIFFLLCYNPKKLNFIDRRKSHDATLH
jgi:hypothetical protein